VAPVLAASGNRSPIAVTISARDITEVRETAAREQAALEASRLKSLFLANMSHEIRTPMNGVIGMAAVLRRTELSAEQQECVDLIQSAADSLLRVINDVLDFSKIEAGKLEVESHEFDFGTLLSETLRPMEFTARGKGLKLEHALVGAPSTRVVGDPGRIRQILTNLVGNAVKFTDQGVVRVRASFASRPGSLPLQLRVEVEDTGPGIEAQARGRIFQPFTQADPSTARRHGGTGLGLSISARLVELLGGTLGFESEPGRGSLFWFEVPLGLGAPRESGAGGSPERSPAPAPRAGGRVLVAEDNPVNQQVVLRMFARMGIEAEAADGGEAALQAIRRGGYALVLMDCHMPGMDGFEAARRIRAETEPAIRDLPIIALTADAMKGVREACFEAGMDDFLPKPLDIEMLESTVPARSGSGPSWICREGRARWPRWSGSTCALRPSAWSASSAHSTRATREGWRSRRIASGLRALRSAPRGSRRPQGRSKRGPARAGSTLCAVCSRGSAPSSGASSRSFGSWRRTPECRIIAAWR
jgi:CheY-like chemotaxis protein/nitrogen-specific signal transduction histidine kinase